MNRKFRLENYEICTNFKSDNVMYVTAEDINTDEYFSNETVQLMRIKKDTVFAALEKKSEKNLKCQIEQIIEDGKRYLVLNFVVSFDYLPEFKEEVKLQFVEQKVGKKNISNLNFQVEIQEMERILNNFSKNGVITHQEVGTVNCMQEKEIWKKEVGKSEYLLKVSGIYTNSSGNNAGLQTIKFTIKVPDHESKEISCSVNSLYGYSYPFNFSTVVDCNEGNLSVLSHKTYQNSNLTSVHVTMVPISTMN